jgi:hypothetical protein
MTVRTMHIRKLVVYCVAVAAFVPVMSALSQGEQQRALTRHLRPAEKLQAAKLIGRMAPNETMQLDVVLNLRDPEGLKAFVKDIYDPTSPNYKHYLTPRQFTERFGPSRQDYDAVLAYARANGFTVAGGTFDGFEAQIKGPVSSVEKAFHVTMLRYQHPTENRTFIVPDREPTADLPFQLWHVTGLDTYSKPHPLLVKKSEYAKAHGMRPEDVIGHATTGSGPSASFLGSDMRAAYYGGTALTGAGQNIGLLEFEGTDLADLTTYYSNVHQTEPVTPVLLSVDGVSTSCTEAAGGCDDGEQTLDMTQAMGMAPGLASLTEYFGNSTDTTQDDSGIISAMTTHSPLPTVIGCSWGWDPVDETTLDPYFEKMAAQGQTFFAASGDSSTWTVSNGAASGAWPADDPYIISVGGTDLKTSSAGGPWASETAWRDSGGGINKDGIPIPAYQQLTGVITSTNMGSTTMRNGPDVSANANFTFYVCEDQEGCSANEYGGTSFAAPMWAGYMALVNQQALANGNPLVGFINPAIYPLGLGSAYTTNFHDITSGKSGTYSANTGYDLVTGWGSPNGAALITTLTAPVLSISPSTGTTATSFTDAINYPAYDASATFYDAVGSATPSTLGTCSMTTSQLNTCSYVFLGSKLGPGIYNMTGSVTWVEVTGATTNSSETTTTPSATVLIIQDGTTTAVAAAPNSVTSAQSSTVTVTVADADTATYNPTGTVTLTDTTNSASLGACTLSSGSCSVLVSGASLATGGNTISASYPGVTDMYTASSGTTTLTLTVPADNTSTSVTANPSSIASTASTMLTATVTDTGPSIAGGVHTPVSVGVTGMVTFTDSTNSASLGSCTLAGGTCSVTAQGSAMATGSNTITANYQGVSGTYNASSGTTMVTVTVVSTNVLTFSSVSHNFGQVQVGTAATAYTLAVKNTSTTTAYPFSLVFTAAHGFTSATNCPASIAAGGSCELAFYFTPAATGAVSATWSLASESGFTYTPSNGGTLSGSGTSQGGVSVTTNGHNFGPVGVGTTSPTYGVELSNSTSAAVTLTKGSVTAPFAAVTNCGATLAAGSSCELEFTFKPTTTSTVQQVYTLSAGGVTITAGGNPLPNGGITLTGN